MRFSLSLLLSILLLFSCSFRGREKKERVKKCDIPLEDEIRFGNYMNEIIMSRYIVYPDERVQRAVERIGKRLASLSPRPELRYTFKVLISIEPNSFSAPGGYVYITTGLLDVLNSKCQVAAAIAREIGHIVYGDHIKVYMEEERKKGGTEILSSLIGMVKSKIPGFNQGVKVVVRSMVSIVTGKGYPKKMELRADRFALELLKKAGYDPSCLLDYLKILRDESIKYREGGLLGSSRKFLEKRIELLEEEL